MIIYRRLNNKIINLLIIGLGFFMVFFEGCKKDDHTSTNVVTTSEISYLSETEATGGGNIYNGGRTSVSSRGICWGTDPMPTIENNRTFNGTGDGSFTSSITGLHPNTTYHVRAYASNTLGISYGNNVSFTTKNSDIPILKTTPISNISTTSCTSGGTVIFGGDGNVISRGVCWSKDYPPTISDHKTINGAGVGTFISNISGLDPTSSYCIRAYATNSEGTAYGNVLYIKPHQTSVTDIDGNVYNTVIIGTQVWTVENLKVTKYQNGEPIENIIDNAIWNNAEFGAYCDYDHNSDNSNTYGRLYNWYATSDARNIAPKGWHVATYEDYQILIDYLGGPFEAEEKMKNDDFNALAGGKRNRDGIFQDMEIVPYFWTSTEYHEGSTWARYISLNGDMNILCLSKNYGFSVRCVRD
jgi:uncharacterized protein (TIGR02145 family)